MNGFSEPDFIACFETTIYLLYCYIRILLLEIMEWWKRSPEKYIYPGHTLNNPKSENELLEFERHKFGIAALKLVARINQKENEIENLVETMQELNSQNWDLLYDYNTANYELCPTTKSKLKLQKVPNRIRLMLDLGVQEMPDQHIININFRITQRILKINRLN